jgi:tRNA-modifying protein YgfZ
MNTAPMAPMATTTAASTEAAWNAEAVRELAVRVGGSVLEDAYGPGIVFGGDAAGAPPSGDAAGAPELGRDQVAPLPDLGLLSVTGADAAKFLHAQLTNDVEHLEPGVARWAGYCTAKGRLLSTFRYWRDAEAIHLAVARPLAGTLRRRLSMFVLRSKARVDDASDATVSFGLLGERVAASVAAAFGLPVPTQEAAASAGGCHLVGLPPVMDQANQGTSRPRWLLVVPAARAAEAWAAATGAAAGGAAPAASAWWRRTEVLAAIPRIVPATTELFVPQMLNFESVDGVNFRKGCYPGQEIVARSQYLGKLKRRMFVAHGAGLVPAPASDVTSAAGGEPCGQVVMAAPDGAGGFDLLFESQVAAVESGPVRAGDAVLALRTLPYALKAID